MAKKKVVRKTSTKKYSRVELTLHVMAPASDADVCKLHDNDELDDLLGAVVNYVAGGPAANWGFTWIGKP
jgi:hypothetical protein